MKLFKKKQAELNAREEMFTKELTSHFVFGETSVSYVTCFHCGCLINDDLTLIHLKYSHPDEYAKIEPFLKTEPTESLNKKKNTHINTC